MTNSRNGSAFGYGDFTNGGESGLTKREYLAGQAMAGFCANKGLLGMTEFEIAALATEQADALLQALELVP
jgi:hypothetical protein